MGNKSHKQVEDIGDNFHDIQFQNKGTKGVDLQVMQGIFENPSSSITSKSNVKKKLSQQKTFKVKKDPFPKQKTGQINSQDSSQALSLQKLKGLPTKKHSSSNNRMNLAQLIKEHNENAETSLFHNSMNPAGFSLGEALANSILKKFHFRVVQSDIHTPLLIAVFKKDHFAMIQEMDKLYKQINASGENFEENKQGELHFQYEVSLAFWFSAHLEYFDICNFLVQKVPMLRKVVGSILKKKNENRLISQTSRVHSRASKKDQHQNSSDNLSGLKLRKSKFLKEEESPISPRKTRLKQGKRKTAEKKKEDGSSDLNNLVPTEVQVNTEDAENIFEKFQDISQLLEVKKIMRNEFPTFMTNILRIVLNKREEKLAQMIAAYYKISFTEEILVQAIESDQFDFLYYLFGFHKNFLYDKVKSESKMITFELFFDYIRDLKPDEDEFRENIKCICEWRLPLRDDNFLQALLTFYQDDLALEYMGSYGNNLNEGLFLYCLEIQNEGFLKNALKLRAFDKMLFREDTVVNKILLYLNQGTRTNYILCVLSLIDISIWKNHQIKQALISQYIRDLMDIFSEFIELNYDKNRLILCYNPIMTIALSCELLQQISQFRKKFENDSKRICNQLLRLGEMIISKINDEKYYERLILDVDFKERVVLKIICQNSFEKLMDEKDPKAENLMSKIWKGKEATNCDGNIFGYSGLTNVVFRPFKQLFSEQSSKYSLQALASNSYEPNFKVDYMIQLRYRSKSINFYFYKEFLSALISLIMFQWLNYQYLQEVQIVNTYKGQFDNGTNSDNMTYSDFLDQMESLQSSTGIINILSIIALTFMITVILRVLTKVLFNYFSIYKITIDKWAIIDTITAILNIAAIYIIRSITLDEFLNPNTKDFVDYFQIFVLTVSWIRFFMYFLVVRSISQLLLTIIEMVEDTISFLFIVSCFILIMSSIFTTLYQDVNPERFGSLTVTVRTLFDASMAVYSYDGMGGRTLSYSILMVFHVYFSNVLLLNYLIAILSTTYDNMKQSGIFKYKKNLFEYCEFYMVTFNDEIYGEMILQPPPLSIPALIFLPFLNKRAIMAKLAKGYTLFVYWFENMFIILFFFMYEVCILPLAYLKTLMNILMSTEVRLLRKSVTILVWIVVGVVVDCQLLIKDCCNLIRILNHSKGFHVDRKYQDDSTSIETQIEILNLARDSVIMLFKALKGHFSGDPKDKLRRKSSKSKKSEDGSKKTVIPLEENKLNSHSSDSFDFSDEEAEINNFNLESELLYLEQNAGYNPNDINCLYVIKKAVLIEDWITRRKMQIEEKIHSKQKGSRKQLEIQSTVRSGKSMRAKSLLLPNDDNQKLIKEESYIEEEDDQGISKGFQKKMNQKQINSRKSKFVVLDGLLSSMQDKTLTETEKKKIEMLKMESLKNKAAPQQSKTQNLDKLEEGEHDFVMDVSKNEIQCITKFFNNFVIISESSLFSNSQPSQGKARQGQMVEHIDIVLFLRAVPERINLENIHKVNLYNFWVCQESLIAYQNLDLVNSFEYYDDKNRERVQQIKTKIQDQKSSLEEVREIVKFIQRKMYRSNNKGLTQKQKEKSTTMKEEKKDDLDLNESTSVKNAGVFSPTFKKGSNKDLIQNLKILNVFSSQPAEQPKQRNDQNQEKNLEANEEVKTDMLPRHQPTFNSAYQFN